MAERMQLVKIIGGKYDGQTHMAVQIGIQEYPGQFEQAAKMGQSDLREVYKRLQVANTYEGVWVPELGIRLSNGDRKHIQVGKTVVYADYEDLVVPLDGMNNIIEVGDQLYVAFKGCVQVVTVKHIHEKLVNVGGARYQRKLRVTKEDGVTAVVNDTYSTRKLLHTST